MFLSFFRKTLESLTNGFSIYGKEVPSLVNRKSKARSSFFLFFLFPQRHRPPKKPYQSLTGTLAPGDECD